MGTEIKKGDLIKFEKGGAVRDGKESIPYSDVWWYNKFLHYKNLFDGTAKLVQLINTKSTHPYLNSEAVQILTLPQTISEKIADLLVGEFPEIEIQEKPETTEIFEDIAKRTRFESRVLEGVTKCSAYGHLFYRAWLDDSKSYFKFIPTEQVLFEENDQDEIIELAILAPFFISQNNQGYIVEHHFIGRIEYYILYTSPQDDNRIKAIGSIKDYDPEREDEEITNLDYIPIVSIKNLGVGGEKYGRSDYYGKDQLFAEIENTLSMISYVLGENTDPWVMLPTGVIGNMGNFKRSNGKWIEKNGSEESVDIISWDASLSSAFEQLKELFDKLLFSARLSPALFGRDTGGNLESGRALKWRSVDTFSMLNRKRRYLDPGIKALIKMLMELEGNKFDDKTVIDISWQDGIPNDTEAKAEYYVQLFNAGLCSKRTAIKNIFDLQDDKSIDIEMQKIETDQKSKADIRSQSAVSAIISAKTGGE